MQDAASGIELEAAYSGPSRTATASTTWTLLGPYPVGALIERVEVQWSTTGATILGLGVGMTSERSASQAAFEGAAHLIGRGGSTLAGRPAVTWQLGAADSGTLLIPVLRVLRVGRRSLIFGWTTTAGGIVTFFTPSAWIKVFA